MSDALYYFNMDALSLPCPECDAPAGRECFSNGFGYLAHTARLPEGYVNRMRPLDDNQDTPHN